MITAVSDCCIQWCWQSAWRGVWPAGDTLPICCWASRNGAAPQRHGASNNTATALSEASLETWGASRLHCQTPGAPYSDNHSDALHELLWWLVCFQMFQASADINWIFFFFLKRCTIGGRRNITIVVFVIVAPQTNKDTSWVPNCTLLILKCSTLIVWCTNLDMGSDDPLLFCTYWKWQQCFNRHLFFIFFYFFNSELQTEAKDGRLHFMTHKLNTLHNVKAWLKCAAIARGTLAS